MNTCGFEKPYEVGKFRDNIRKGLLFGAEFDISNVLFTTLIVIDYGCK